MGKILERIYSEWASMLPEEIPEDYSRCTKAITAKTDDLCELYDNKKEVELLDDLIKLYDDFIDMSERDSFAQGFSIGAQVMEEILNAGKKGSNAVVPDYQKLYTTLFNRV